MTTLSKQSKFSLAGKVISIDLFFFIFNTSVLVLITCAVDKSTLSFEENVQAIPHLIDVDVIHMLNYFQTYTSTIK